VEGDQMAAELETKGLVRIRAAMMAAWVKNEPHIYLWPLTKRVGEAIGGCRYREGSALPFLD